MAKDPMIGAHLGEYVVQERIGAGGMGIVYGGVHPVIGKRVAIKVLQWETAQNPEEAARLKAEARLVNSIGHRGIVDIYDFGTTRDGRDYVVMELLSGEPLDRVVATRAPLPVPEVLSMLEEICDALAAAHGAGVIHRDLKPNNVFYVAPPHGARYLKLLDFGLAKKTTATQGDTSAQTKVGMVVGTPYYMSPEQARGQPVSPQTDLYSMGVMAFELLTGKLPFDAPSPFEVISLHLNAPPPSMLTFERSLPPVLDELVLKMLSKAPGDRPPSAAAVRGELKRLKNRLQSDATHIGGMPMPGIDLDDEPAGGAEGPTTVPVRPISPAPQGGSESGQPMRTLEYGTPNPPRPARMVQSTPSPGAPQPAPAAPKKRGTSTPPAKVPTPAPLPPQAHAADTLDEVPWQHSGKSSMLEAVPPNAEKAISVEVPAQPPIGVAASASNAAARTSRNKGMMVGAIAAVATFCIGTGGWWLVARPSQQSQPIPELPNPPPDTKDEPERLAPVPPPQPDAKPEVKVEPKPNPKHDPRPEAVKAEPKADPKKPKPAVAVAVAKKPDPKPADVGIYRRGLLGRIDTLMNKLESQDDQMELTSAKALRGRTTNCATQADCKEFERQLSVMEKRHR
ncbi:MAG TPA: protein kinase [Myxococcales bacterium]